MKILCATDFSESANRAASVAARLAASTRGTLHLLHVANLPLGAAGSAESTETELARRRQLLDELARKIGDTARGTVSTEVVDGVADESIVARAQGVHAELIVLGPVGAARKWPWRLGSVAMRVLKGASVPVLVVRNDAALAEWTAGKRPLRVLVALDRSKPAREALAWSEQLSRFGSVDLTVGHAYEPVGPQAGRSLAHHATAEPEHRRTEAAVAAELRELIASCAPKLTPRLRLSPGWGGAAHHLLDLAESERAELVVVGTHRRQGIDRLIHGSVALDIAAHATSNILVVPSAAAEPAKNAGSPAPIRRVLVPCDLSSNSARAVDWACALLASGGELVLLHVAIPYVAVSADFAGSAVLPPASNEELAREAAETEARLRALVPATAKERGILTRCELVSGFDAAQAIAAAARRLAPDALCLTTHGRSGLSRALMGSVAEGVLRHVRVPMFMIPPPAES